MKISLLTLVTAAMLAITQPLAAGESANKSAEEPGKVIEEALKKVAPSLAPTSIKPSKIEGLYEIIASGRLFYMTSDGKYLLQGRVTDLKASKKPTVIPGIDEFVSGSKLFYVSGDGNYFIEGSLIDVKSNKDLTEARLGEGRIAALDKLGVNNMIVFKPKPPKKANHVVYIFTDIDCGYCRKLHSEIEQYMTAGIEIRYLFFPRAGVGSDSYNKAVAVWCAKDKEKDKNKVRQDALTKAKKGDSIDMEQCDNPVKAHMQLGEEFGASGTPMLVTEKGTIIPGYVNAISLAQGLEKEAAK
jgi:thiol:disulfide interchange protein DsbC